MDYVEGTSLAELRKELANGGRAMDVRVGSRIVLDALSGLHAAHELRDESGRHLGIVHRDVSPHNVLIGCDGRAHLTDFGIAKAEDRVQTTRTHEVKGKLAYLAPERIDKRRVCTVQSDVFSMAVVMWECFAGRRLFRGEDAVETLQEVIGAPIPTLRQIGAQVPQALDDVIARALSRDLDTRYPTAAEFAQAVERAVGRDTIGSHADVARLMEALFGARMALRHEHIRETIGSTNLDQLLEESGLPSRDRTSVTLRRAGNIISELPPAPSGRYSFGHISPPRESLARKPKWWLAAGLAAGLASGALLTVLLTSRRAEPPPIVMTRATFSAAPTVPTPADMPAPPPAPTIRKVYVKLPFLATLVTYDDAARDLDPAVEGATFEVAVESGVRHHVTATALDGTRAEAYVREAEGPAFPEGDGFAMTAPAASHAAAVVELRATTPIAPLGTMRNGFTKLK
jgi:serine/threonine-protein kinase